MFRRTSYILTFVLTLLLSAFAFATPETLTGTVTDTMCGKKHMIPGKTDAECTQECMKSKGNWTYGLVVGDKVYSLSGDTKKFDTFAGQHVKVTGEVTGTTITVQTIARPDKASVRLGGTLVTRQAILRSIAVTTVLSFAVLVGGHSATAAPSKSSVHVYKSPT